MKELSANLKNTYDKVKKLDEEKGCMSAQLREALNKMNDLNATAEQPDVQRKDGMLGEVMADKFTLERKVSVSLLSLCCFLLVRLSALLVSRSLYFCPPARPPACLCD